MHQPSSRITEQLQKVNIHTPQRIKFANKRQVISISLTLLLTPKLHVRNQLMPLRSNQSQSQLMLLTSSFTDLVSLQNAVSEVQTMQSQLQDTLQNSGQLKTHGEQVMEKKVISDQEEDTHVVFAPDILIPYFEK